MTTTPWISECESSPQLNQLVYWETFFSSHQILTFSIFVICRLFFGFGSESMDHSLRMYQQNSANVGFESEWVVILNYIGYITVWSPSVLGAWCGCFSGSAEGYRKLYASLISESFDKLPMLRLQIDSSQEIEPFKNNNLNCLTPLSMYVIW